jgi:lysophospholipase L1-like esterase
VTRASHDFGGQTLREVVSPHFGGDVVRIRLSNQFGQRPVAFGQASVARRRSGASLVPGTTRALTFRGSRSVTIPPGQTAFSDPVRLHLGPFTDLAVSLYAPGSTGPATEHPVAVQTSYAARGNQVNSDTRAAFSHTMNAWDFLTGIEVQASRRTRTVVAFGDSITNGAESTPDRNRRWPDALAHRLEGTRSFSSLAVVNSGISGNRVLHDTGTNGPSALSRLSSDVLSQPALGAVIMLEGINDIGSAEQQADHSSVSAQAIIEGYRAIIRRVHGAGAKVLVGTLTPAGDHMARAPFGPDYSSPAGVAKRQMVNQWIRQGRGFDGMVDFDRAIRDPRFPNHIRPRYNSGDNLHPNDAGYSALADAVPGKLLRAIGSACG